MTLDVRRHVRRVDRADDDSRKNVPLRAYYRDCGFSEVGEAHDKAGDPISCLALIELVPG